MRYQNAAELLPAELLEALQGYLDGGYLYIPRRAEHLRRSFFAVPSLRLPPRGPLCYNGRESEARYP